ncbi:hypothetical protein FBZ89_11120 [Nitrospirillum amazonense]|uniref:Uncharacterized protein n=2 Tax=Nitrospirillum amazonense TaxID=28077 RepID=A0A560F6C3_9PROT|nr:hypothetical protein FBZ89_11120 [Nitrospirillum amazonense]
MTKGSGMKRVMEGVTVRTFPQVAHAAGLAPDQPFAIVITDPPEAPPSPSTVIGDERERMNRFLALAGLGVRTAGARTQADIDAGIRDFRDDR